MTVDDDDVKALENRLRQSGWIAKTSDEHLATRKRRPVAPPPIRFGGLDGLIKAAAQQLANDHDGFAWPLYRDIAEAFRFSFDDAVRALSEAKRLSGEDR